MKSGSIAVMAVLGSFLFLSCKSEPAFRVTVPGGWTVAAEEAGDGTYTKTLTSDEHKPVAIVVGYASIDKLPMEVILAENLAIINQLDGQVTEFSVAEDKSSVRVAFTAEVGEAGTLIGKLILKRDSAGKGKVVTAIGLWPAAVDGAISPAYDVVAASVDFR